MNGWEPLSDLGIQRILRKCVLSRELTVEEPCHRCGAKAVGEDHILACVRKANSENVQRHNAIVMHVQNMLTAYRCVELR